MHRLKYFRTLSRHKPRSDIIFSFDTEDFTSSRAADGEVLTGIASVDYTERGFDIVEIKVIGFTTDEHKNANLALGVYVIDAGSISYVQATKPSEGEKYSYVSYNSLIGG